jgi:hypothetical protein
VPSTVERASLAHDGPYSSDLVSSARSPRSDKSHGFPPSDRPSLRLEDSHAPHARLLTCV